MAESSTIPETKPRRPGGALSAARIADAALALIDEDGVEAFSFRILAAQLGCQAMSIYHYFPSKTHLFEVLVERLIGEAGAFPDTGSWRGRLLLACRAYRKMALRHPGMFMYFSTFRLNTASGLNLLERYFTILADAGLQPEAQARHFRILRGFLTGACLEDAVKGASAVAPMPFVEARLAYPAMMAAAAFAGADRAADSFDAGIRVLTAGIEADLSN